MAEKGQAPVIPVVRDAGIPAETGDGRTHRCMRGADQPDNLVFVSMLDQRKMAGLWWRRMIAVQS